ncbi:amidohydrolase [Subtercola sp. YIM 133946]|uniref:amidohydrolase n=1 Tax=Subtercola sp. YIM 133946 TaxID=3118909 RepID=UPI002F92319E
MPDAFLRRGRIPGRDAECDVLLADGRVRAIVPTGVVRPPRAAEVLELDGRFVIPGLWDNHVHFTQWALVSSRLDVSAASSAAEVVGLLLAGAARPGTAPLIGFGVRDGLWPDASALDSALLDTVSATRAIVLISADLHGCWLNSAALAQYGLSGHPTGHLREDECFAVMRRLDDVSDDVGDALVETAAVAAARLGVVGIVDLEMRDNLSDWRRRIERGTRSLRVSFGIYGEHLEQSIRAGLRTGDVIAGTDGLLSVGPFKVITDGSLNTRTAYCYDEYEGLEGHEHSRGMLTVAPDALLALLERATRAGLTPAVHAIGDHANALALDTFERLAADAVATGARIEHAQLVAAADFARFAALGVIASVQPEHAMDDRDVADRYWAGRTDRAFALERLRASGADLVLGSDAPVAPLDPWQTMAAAVSRARGGRAPWHPEQRVTAQYALTASTSGPQPFAASASAGGLPSIGVGMPADIAVIERDPLRIAPDDLRGMPVAATFLAGRPTHQTL